MNPIPSSVLDPPANVTTHPDLDTAVSEHVHLSLVHVPSVQPIATAAWHAFFWLVLGNAIGVMIAILLLVPSANVVLGEWTYGRWMMVHMNILLYGWCSLPML